MTIPKVRRIDIVTSSHGEHERVITIRADDLDALLEQIGDSFGDGSHPVFENRAPLADPPSAVDMALAVDIVRDAIKGRL